MPARGRIEFRPWTVLILLIAFMVAVPVLVVAAFVLVPSGDIWQHLASTVLASYVINSLWLMIGVGAGVLVLGVGTAWLVTMADFPGRRLFEWALLLPLAVPAYVIAYTYTGLLDYAGPVQSGLRDVFGWTSARDYWFPEIRSLGGAIVMMTLVLYPYVYLLARSAFLEQSVCALEVSRTLGCSSLRSFLLVAIPLARPSIVAGVALAQMEALNDFGTVQYFAVDTFTTGIYRTWFGLGSPAAAAQLAAVFMLFMLVLILFERWHRRGARFHHATVTYRPLPRRELDPGRRALTFMACLAPVAFGFLIPCAALTVWTIETFDKTVDARFFKLALHSLTLATIASACAVLLAVIMAYGNRLRPGRVTELAIRVVGMGYAIPGAVVAVGVLLPFAAIDNSVDTWMRAIFGISTGLLLSGTLFAVIYAYLVRFLAVSVGTVEASLGRVTRSMDGAARTLGAGTVGTLWRVHAPIMWSSLLTAGLLVFVDVMKELPATLIIRPFNYDTLAIRVFELASDEQLAESSSAALAIVLVGIVPVVILSRAIARARPGDHHG
ncbi:MAG: iron ABC transporter permease [Alphaproteobacteria bacterium]|nr:iron ABC transporter permease [Alphaproteobacteria bacterium]